MKAVFDAALCRDVAVVRGHSNSLRLKEHDAGASLRELVITGVPDLSLVIDLDPVEGVGTGKKVKLKRYSWFFRADHPLAPKQCDGAVYFTHDENEYLCLIELKSSISGLAHGRKQLKSGAAFARYVGELTGRALTICTRLIYVGAPLPAPVLASPQAVVAHAEIPVHVSSGTAYLSYGQLIR